MPRNTNDFRADLPSVHRAIAAWYKAHGRRDLPWRNTTDPYAVYISEIMLQQTQVKTVLERYYQPFLAQFPTIAALAKAPSQEVMKAWEGLGYYTRVRNLHAAAQQAGKDAIDVEELYRDDPAGESARSADGGSVPPLSKTQPQRRLSVNYSLPSTVEELLALPGVGRNTAHAVACFGFGAAVPVMEANVKRVLARVFAMKTLDDKQLWEHAELLLDKKNPFDYNQAMMDIGALLCTKRKPRCGECPLASICRGKTSPEAYPVPRKAKATPTRERDIFVLMDKQGRVYIERRATRFLGGLFGFIEKERGDKTYPKARLIGQVRQVYSHFMLEGRVFLVKNAPVGKGGQWVEPGKLAGLPLSRADSKITALLADFLGN